MNYGRSVDVTPHCSWLSFEQCRSRPPACVFMCGSGRHISVFHNSVSCTRSESERGVAEPGPYLAVIPFSDIVSRTWTGRFRGTRWVCVVVTTLAACLLWLHVWCSVHLKQLYMGHTVGYFNNKQKNRILFIFTFSLETGQIRFEPEQNFKVFKSGPTCKEWAQVG